MISSGMIQKLIENGSIKIIGCSDINKEFDGTLHLGSKLIRIPKKLLDTKNPYSIGENDIEVISISEDGIIIEPDYFYLGVTEEYTQCSGVIPRLAGLSEQCISGLNVHITADLGNIGYKGRWTLEISTTYPIKLYAGDPIGRIFFNITESETASYKGLYSNSHTDSPCPKTPGAIKVLENPQMDTSISKLGQVQSNERNNGIILTSDELKLIFPENIGPNSIELTTDLGSIFTPKEDLSFTSDSSRELYAQMCQGNFSICNKVGLSDNHLLLNPGRLYFFLTNEKLNIPANLQPVLYGKTSFSLCGISVFPNGTEYLESNHNGKILLSFSCTEKVRMPFDSKMPVAQMTLWRILKGESSKGVLTGEKIRKLINDKSLCIYPFYDECVNPNSIDVHIGSEFYEFNNDDGIINMFGENNIIRREIPSDGYVLVPGKVYDFQIHEYVAAPYEYIPIFHGKSTCGRFSIGTHNSAGMGSIGFRGKFNISLTVQVPVKIYPYMAIGQIEFVPVHGQITDIYNGSFNELTAEGLEQKLQGRTRL